jgi:ribosomal subunit interface protein
MIKYSLKATKIEHTPAITSYIEKKLKDLERVLDKKDTSIHAELEVGKSTTHHKQGELYFAEINLHAMKKKWRAVEEADNLYAAIDAMRDAIVREVTSGEKKERVKSRKGAREIKKRMKGV